MGSKCWVRCLFAHPLDAAPAAPRARGSRLTLSDRIGRDGQPYEMEPLSRAEIKAKPGEPGHDDAINEETRRRRYSSRFAKYAYRRLDKRLINALEEFAHLTAIVQAGTLSQSRYGKESGTIDSANYGERALADRVLRAATRRRGMMQAVMQHAPGYAMPMLKIAVEFDKTPKEITEAFFKSREKADPHHRCYRLRLDDRAKAAIALVHIRDALNVIADFIDGRLRP